MSRVSPVLLMCLLSCLCIATVAAGDETPWVDANRLGLESLDPGEDATPVFRRAVEECRKVQAKGIRIPEGEWHVFPDYAFQRTLAVANNNPGVKRIIFALDGLDDVTLEGHGARLICHGPMIPISAQDTNGLTLRGITIDWARPFNFQGEVIAAHPDMNAFDLRVHNEVIYELRNGRLIFREKPSPSPDHWKQWAPPTSELMSWEHNIQWNMWFDGATKRPIPGEHLWAVEPDPRVEEIEPGFVRVFDAVRQLPAPGMVLTLKGMKDPNRTSPAIRIARSSDVLIEDVTIHHAGGMGVIVQRTNGAVLRRVNVTLPPGKQRFVTTTADATHFNGCRGDLLLEDCTFENMLDDATNIHGCFVRVEKQHAEDGAAAVTLVCRRVHSQQLGLIVMQAGDRVRFITSDDLQAYGDATVVSTNELNFDLFEVTLDRLPSGGIREESALYNLTWQPNLTFRNCTVRNNRARTMLLATAGDVVVENNKFLYCSMAGIQFEGDNGFWWESGPTRQVVIRNNLFRDNYGAVLRIAPQIDTKKHPDALYHGGITFEDNTIETFHRTVAEGSAIDGLTIRNNTFAATDTFGGTSDVESPSFVFHSGRNILIEENRVFGTPPLTVKAGTPLAVPTMRDNKGIELAQ